MATSTQVITKTSTPVLTETVGPLPVESTPVSPATSTPVLTVGPLPVEAKGGSPFNDIGYTGIRSMKIGHGDIVRSICIEYERNGQPEWIMHGTNEEKIDWITFYPDEFLVSVSGTSTVEFADNQLVIRTLKIITSTRILGPYGTPRAGALPFSTESNGCKIVGFHGRSGVVMNSIGTYLVPQPQISIGPFGGRDDGDEFNDGIHPSILQLRIRYGNGFVLFQTLYATPDGQNHWSDNHGLKADGPDGPDVIVNLALDEYLISLSGYYHTEGSNKVVHSLTFESNKATYGPFGNSHACGKPFSTSTFSGTGKIVGFYGTKTAGHLNSIGAHFEPLP